jgi:hypothetical protein
MVESTYTGTRWRLRLHLTDADDERVSNVMTMVRMLLDTDNAID